MCHTDLLVPPDMSHTDLLVPPDMSHSQQAVVHTAPRYVRLHHVHVFGAGANIQGLYIHLRGSGKLLEHVAL